MADIQTSMKEATGRALTAEYIASGTRRAAIEIPVVRYGEVIQQVWFPHSYTVKPLHSFGVEIVGNQPIPTGKTPLTSVLVKSWNTRITPDGVVLYEGCRVVCVVAGNSAVPENARFTFKVIFEGMAVVTPFKQ